MKKTTQHALINTPNKPDGTIDSYEDHLDIKKELIEVKARRIQAEITSDLILASFENDKDRQYILDMAYSAAYCQDTMQDALTQWKRYYKHNLNTDMPKNEEQAIKQIIDETTALFLNRINMFSILRRNVRNNELVKLILQNQTEDEPDEDTPQGMEKLTKAIKQKLKNREHEEQER